MNGNGHPEVAAALGTRHFEATGGDGREYLTRSAVHDLGFPRRAVDAIFGHCPVILLPGYSRPMVCRSDLEAFLAEHTYGEGRVRP